MSGLALILPYTEIECDHQPVESVVRDSSVLEIASKNKRVNIGDAGQFLTWVMEHKQYTVL